MLLQYCVKAFSTDPLEGNPAAVVLLNEMPSARTLQRIAFVNGFPETVFLLTRMDDPGNFDIRWFTPAREVVNAGHATLAAQYVLASIEEADWRSIALHWKDPDTGLDGVSIVSRDRADSLTYGPVPAFEKIDLTVTAFASHEVWQCGHDVVVLLDSEEEVKEFRAPLADLVSLPYRGLCITAPATNHDYCSRFFAPAYGVPEDYVTASAHHYLARYWADRLDKSELSAVQHSSSAGMLRAVVMPDRVELQGRCCLFSTSKLHL